MSGRFAGFGGSVATIGRADYLGRMVASRILRMLTMLAVLLMPIGMLGGEAAAMGHSAPIAAAAMADHCAAMHHKQKKDEPAKGADCVVACAAIPASDAPYQHETLAPMHVEAPRLIAVVAGLHPEAATPPPRIS